LTWLQFEEFPVGGAIVSAWDVVITHRSLEAEARDEKKKKKKTRPQMSAPIDPANTSQTKHRAVGATIDGDEPRVVAGADLADVDVTTADNGSSSGGSGGKRKRAPGMILCACFLASFWASMAIFSHFFRVL
jgi:hypothetical protein